MKFRKRPIVVEAEQWFPGVVVGGVREETYDPHEGYTVPRQVGYVVVKGKTHRIEAGDWIVVGPDGRRKVWKPAEFAESFEPVKQAEAGKEPKET